jgi:hypothetical protein
MAVDKSDGSVQEEYRQTDSTSSSVHAAKLETGLREGGRESMVEDEEEKEQK